METINRREQRNGTELPTFDVVREKTRRLFSLDHPFTCLFTRFRIRPEMISYHHTWFLHVYCSSTLYETYCGCMNDTRFGRLQYEQ